MEFPKPKTRETFETPSLRHLKPEEAKQFLVHHANMGDQGARDILDLVLPPNSDGGAEPP